MIVPKQNWYYASRKVRKIYESPSDRFDGKLEEYFLNSLYQGIAGAVAATGETINIIDAYSDPRFRVQEVLRQICAHEYCVVVTV